MERFLFVLPLLPYFLKLYYINIFRTFLYGITYYTFSLLPVSLSSSSNCVQCLPPVLI